MRDVRRELEDLADDGEPRGAAALMRDARASIAGERPRPHRSAGRRCVMIGSMITVALLSVAGGAVVVARDSVGGSTLAATDGVPPETDTSTSVSSSTTATSTSVPAVEEPAPSTPDPTLPVVGAPEMPTTPTAVHAEGSYEGSELYNLHVPGSQCSFVTHRLDATFALTDGTRWQFHSDYCGTLEGDMWTGTGTFTFTTGDGSTFWGTTTNSAIVPSVGEPYTLDITGGTGRFGGARGRCELDNHLREIVPWSQEHYGTFTCDINAS